MYDVVIPVSVDHIKQLKLNLPFIKTNLNPSSIIIIGSKAVGREFLEDNDIIFFEENSLFADLNYEIVKELLLKQGGNPKRSGWYFQQFVKMQYAFVCNDNSYVVWDADTVPLRKISFIDSADGKYLYNLKDEHHIPYFQTMDSIFGEGKYVYGTKSYISEGMIIDVKIMKELIKEIAGTDDGVYWYKKIIESISPDDLSGSGFSEFETYGTFVANCHPQLYKLRTIATLRDGYDEFGRIPKAEELLEYAENYDTISFENRYSRNVYLPSICNKITFDHDGVIKKRYYLNDNDFFLLNEHEKKLIERINSSKRVFLYGAGFFGIQYRFYLRLINMEKKLGGYIVTQKKDGNCYGVDIFSADEYFDKVYEEGDLVILTVSEPIRKELLKTGQFFKYDHTEAMDLFALNLNDIVRTIELEELISEWKSDYTNIIPDKDDKVLVVDFNGLVSEKGLIHVKELMENKHSTKYGIDLVTKNGTVLPKVVSKIVDKVYYYQATDRPETYSDKMITMVDKFIDSNSIPIYEYSYLLRNLPVVKSNYLDAALLCIKCSKNRSGYLSLDSAINRYYANMWSGLFDIN